VCTFVSLPGKKPGRSFKSFELLNHYDMTLDNTNVQMRKGVLEFCVLHIIARGEVYTSDLIEELTNARMVVVEGTLYPLLTRLKNAGLLEYKWVESVSGPPRKYFTLTPTGAEVLVGLNQTWADITQSVAQIIGKQT
jgi:PadR family transcriptional regulator, regulatory protein PadR